jgi:putative oxidoreductase
MKTLLQRTIHTITGLDTLAVRLGAGIVFSAHGSQKLFGWFDGYGLDGTAGWMDSIGLGPGMLMAVLAGSAEFFGGLLLIAGLLVRPAAVVLAFTMLVAIVSVHLNNGLFMANNGYEYGLVLLVLSIGLIIRGAGSLSVDLIVQKKLSNS